MVGMKLLNVVEVNLSDDGANLRSRGRECTRHDQVGGIETIITWGGNGSIQDDELV